MSDPATDALDNPGADRLDAALALLAQGDHAALDALLAAPEPQADAPPEPQLEG